MFEIEWLLKRSEISAVTQIKFVTWCNTLVTLDQGSGTKTLDSNDLDQAESTILEVSRGLSNKNALEATLEAHQNGGERDT